MSSSSIVPLSTSQPGCRGQCKRWAVVRRAFPWRRRHPVAAGRTPWCHHRATSPPWFPCERPDRRGRRCWTQETLRERRRRKSLNRDLILLHYMLIFIFYFGVMCECLDRCAGCLWQIKTGLKKSRLSVPRGAQPVVQGTQQFPKINPKGHKLIKG